MATYDVSLDPLRNRLKDKLMSLRAQGYSDDQIMEVAPKLRQEVEAATRGPGPWEDHYTLPKKADRLKISNINLQNQQQAIEAEPGPSLGGEIGDAFKGQWDAIKDPQKRREIERGLSDTVTFGGAEALTKKIAPLLGDESFGDEQAAKDAQDVGPGYRTGGAVAGALLPGGSKKIIDSAGALATRAGKAIGSRAGGALVGGAVGAASVPVTSGLISGAQEAIGKGDVTGAPGAAWEAFKDAGTSPLALGLGAVGGAAGGYSGALRGGNSQTAQDIALRQEMGGSPSITQGAKGGVFNEPEIKGLRGSTAEVGAVAKNSARKVANDLTSQFKEEVGKPYAEAKATIEGSNDLTDFTPVIDEANKVIASKGTPTSVRALLKKELIDDLAEYKRVYVSDDGTAIESYRMPVSVANDVRQKLSDFAKTGAVDVPRGNAKIGQVYDTARGMVGDFEDANAAYSAGKDKFGESFRQLGSKKPMNKLPEGPGAKVKLAQENAIKQISDRLFQHGEGARLEGQTAEDIAAFIKDHHEQEMNVRFPEFLATKNRLSFKVPEGGLLPSVKGLVTQNIEPLEANVAEPVARSMRTLGPTAGAVTNPVIRAYLADQERQRRLSDLVKSAGR